MTFQDAYLAYRQRQEYLANLAFQQPEEVLDLEFVKLYTQIHDAVITEEERWEELCLQPYLPR